MPMIHGNAALRAEIRRMTEWFDIKLYREVVEPLMNERMRKRLVNRESPDTRVLREAMRIAVRASRLSRLSARPSPLARRARPQPRRFHRRRAFERDRLSRRARLARAQADQGLVCGDEVAALLPPAARRADGSDRPARAITTRSISDPSAHAPRPDNCSRTSSLRCRPLSGEKAMPSTSMHLEPGLAEHRASSARGR